MVKTSDEAAFRSKDIVVYKAQNFFQQQSASATFCRLVPGDCHLVADVIPDQRKCIVIKTGADKTARLARRAGFVLIV